MPMTCCMCEPIETAHSLWRGHTCSGHQAKVRITARTPRRVRSSAAVGCEPGGAQARTWAEVNVRPRTIVMKQAEDKARQ